jgi:hypothetical protein
VRVRGHELYRPCTYGATGVRYREWSRGEDMKKTHTRRGRRVTAEKTNMQTVRSTTTYIESGETTIYMEWRKEVMHPATKVRVSGLPSRAQSRMCMWRWLKNEQNSTCVRSYGELPNIDVRNTDIPLVTIFITCDVFTEWYSRNSSSRGWQILPIAHIWH